MECFIRFVIKNLNLERTSGQNGEELSANVIAQRKTTKNERRNISESSISFTASVSPNFPTNSSKVLSATTSNCTQRCDLEFNAMPSREMGSYLIGNNIAESECCTHGDREEIFANPVAPSTSISSTCAESNGNGRSFCPTTSYNIIPKDSTVVTLSMDSQNDSELMANAELGPNVMPGAFTSQRNALRTPPAEDCPGLGAEMEGSMLKGLGAGGAGGAAGTGGAIERPPQHQSSTRTTRGRESTSSKISSRNRTITWGSKKAVANRLVMKRVLYRKRQLASDISLALAVTGIAFMVCLLEIRMFHSHHDGKQHNPAPGPAPGPAPPPATHADQLNQLKLPYRILMSDHDAHQTENSESFTKANNSDNLATSEVMPLQFSVCHFTYSFK